MFSKSERFKDNDDIIPPVGAYEVGGGLKKQGPSFEKSDRFRESSPAKGVVNKTLEFNSTPANKHSTAKKHSTLPRTAKPTSTTKASNVTEPSTGEIADLEQQIRKLVGERNDLVKQLAACKIENTKLDGKLQYLTKDKSELQASVAALERENRDLIRGKDVLQSKVSSTPDNRKLQNELALAQQQLESSQKEINRLSSQLTSVNKQWHNEVSALKDKQQNQVAKINKLKEEVSTVSKRNEDLVEQMVKVQETSQDFESNLEAANKELDLSKDQIEQMRKENEETLVELRSTKEALEKNQHELDEEHAQNEQVTEELNKLKGTYSNTLEELEISREEIKKIEKEKESRDNEIARLLAEIQKLKQEICTLQEQLQAEQKKCKKLSKEKDVLTREISSQNDKIREMAKHEKELVENLKSLEEELEKLQKLLKEKDKTLKKTSSERDNYKREVDGLQKDSETFQKRISELENLISTQMKHKSEEGIKSLKVAQVHTKLNSTKCPPKDEVDMGTNKHLAKTQQKIVELQASEVLEPENQIDSSKEETDNSDSCENGLANYTSVPEEGLLLKVKKLQEEILRLKKEKNELEEAYIHLKRKWKPFQDQLDGMEIEYTDTKLSLAQNEMEKISAMYAKLFGHQNQRQKIQHVKKLKEENMNLKQEIAQLNNTITKLNRQVKRLEEEKGLHPTTKRNFVPGTPPLSNKN